MVTVTTKCGNPVRRPESPIFKHEKSKLRAWFCGHKMCMMRDIWIDCVVVNSEHVFWLGRIFFHRSARIRSHVWTLLDEQPGWQNKMKCLLGEREVKDTKDRERERQRTNKMAQRPSVTYFRLSHFVVVLFSAMFVLLLCYIFYRKFSRALLFERVNVLYDRIIALHTMLNHSKSLPTHCA